MQFWQTDSGQSVVALGAPHAPVRALAVSADGRELVIADQGSRVTVYDLHDFAGRMAGLGLELPGFGAK